MASNLSSVGTEVNQVVDDEKEEGEISLDDVSSSEEGQPYNPPRGLANCCPHCKSVQTCATWCGTLITYKNNVKKGIGRQGKENRANRQRLAKDPEPLNAGAVSKPPQPGQPKKNVTFELPLRSASDDLVPISSGSDIELSDIEIDEAKKKKKKPLGKKKRKKHRRKSESVSPSGIDIALLVKESIHKIESKKESTRSRPADHHHSPDRRKPSPRRRNRSPVTWAKRRLRSPGLSSRLPRKSSSAPRKRRSRSKPSRKSPKSPSLSPPEDSAEPPAESPSAQGSVNRLLKKVRRLETFSCKSGDKGTSLKDKLIGIIQPVKSAEQAKPKLYSIDALAEASAETPKEKSIGKEDHNDSVKEVVKEEPVIKTETIEESNNEKSPVKQNDKKSDHVDKEKEALPAPKEVETEPAEEAVSRDAARPASPLMPPDVSPPPSPSAKLPNFCIDDNEEDLKLRMIALHSAVLKKHRTRMQKSGKLLPLESPFTPSFFKDFPQLAEVCNPALLSGRDDIYCPEDMELDSDLELDKDLDEVELNMAPSPVEDVPDDAAAIAFAQLTTPQKQQPPADLSLYSPSNPTATPVPTTKTPPRALSSTARAMNDSLFEFVSQECRPYSPSDLTVYDPELPGVHNRDKSNADDPGAAAAAAAAAAPPPLQPPPLPPLSMLDADESLILDPILEPMMPPPLPPPALLNNFPGVPQPMNPLLMPAPIFTFAAPIAPVPAPVSNNSTPAASSLAEILSGTSSRPPVHVASPPVQRLDCPRPVQNDLDNFGETDLDGSPLVPIEKSTPQASWPLFSGSHCLRDRSNVIRTEPERAAVPASEHNSLVQQDDVTLGGFSVKPAVSKSKANALFKPMRVQTLPKKCVSASSAAAFNMSADDEYEAEEEAVENKKESRMLSVSERLKALNAAKVKDVSPSHSTDRVRRLRSRSRSRRRKKSVAPSRHKEAIERNGVISKSKVSQTSSEAKSSKDRGSDKRAQSDEEDGVKTREDTERRGSIEDDAEALREQLLASLRDRQNKTLLAKTIKSEPSSADVSLKTPVVEQSEPIHKPSSEATAKTTSTTAVATTTTEKLLPAKRPLPIETANQPEIKVMKKTNFIPASTKVVNNAKRYQNSLLQRRLINQKMMAATRLRSKLSGAQVSLNDSNQSLVISVNEDESEKEPETEGLKQIEMSVEQFLKNMRQQQEKAAAKSTSSASSAQTLPSTSTPITTTKSSCTTTVTDTASNTPSTIATTLTTTPGTLTLHLYKGKSIFTSPNTSGLKKFDLMTTPQVVKHLPAQLQEEYLRLKKQIIERERLKLQKSKELATVASTANADSTTITVSSTEVDSSATASKTSTILDCSAVATEKPAASAASTSSSITTISPATTKASTGDSTSSSLITSTPISSNSKSTTSKTLLGTSLDKQLSPIQKRTSSETQETVAAGDASKCQVVNPMATANKVPRVVITKNIVPVKTSRSNQNKGLSNGIPTTVTASSMISKNHLTSSKTSANNQKVAPKPAISSRAQKLNKDIELIEKMNNIINSQKQQISAVAQKVSTLRILTKDQINQKTSQIQQTISGSKDVVQMDDLNNPGNNISVSVEEKNEPQAALPNSAKDKDKNVVTEKSKNEKNKDSQKLTTQAPSQPTNEQQSSCARTSQNQQKPNHQDWKEFRETVSDEVQFVFDLSVEEQKKLLSESEEKLITKRHMVLSDIDEMSDSLTQWEVERDLQNTLSIEIQQLREKLRIAEEKMQQQKEKLNAIQPKVSMYHEKINGGRKECFKLMKICDNLGQIITGPDYKVPTTGAELLRSKVNEVAAHTHRLKNKTNQANRNINNNSTKSKSTNNNLSKKQKNANNLKSNSAARSSNVQSNKTTNVESSVNNESVTISKTNGVSSLENVPQIESQNQAIKSTVADSSIEIIDNNNTSNLTTDKQPTESVASNAIVKTEGADVEMSEVINTVNDNETINIDSSNSVIPNSTVNLISTENNSINAEPDNQPADNNVVNTTITLNNTEQEVVCSNRRPNTRQSSRRNPQNIIKDKIKAVNRKNNSAVLKKSLPRIRVKNINVLRGLDTELNKNPGPSEECLNNQSETVVNCEENTKSASANVTEVENVNLISNNESLINSEKSSVPNTADETQSLETVESNLNTNSRKSFDKSISSVSELNEVSESRTETDNTNVSSSNTESFTLLEEISLLEEANNIEVPKKVDIYKRTKKAKSSKQFPKKIMGCDNNKSKSPKNFQPYESILKHLHEPRKKIDGILCPYELTGTCNDEDCQFIHLTARHCSG